jgi:hypothetical protein
MGGGGRQVLPLVWALDDIAVPQFLDESVSPKDVEGDPLVLNLPRPCACWFGPSDNLTVAAAIFR